ncbi:MAG: hypothetical protein AB7V43_22960, partial [Acidimicrobiia bacterium]
MAPPKRKGGRTLPGTKTDGSAANSAPTSGRVTKKVTAGAADSVDRAHHAFDSSSRYTPPV